VDQQRPEGAGEVTSVNRSAGILAFARRAEGTCTVSRPCHRLRCVATTAA